MQSELWEISTLLVNQTISGSSANIVNISDMYLCATRPTRSLRAPASTPSTAPDFWGRSGVLRVTPRIHSPPFSLPKAAVLVSPPSVHTLTPSSSLPPIPSAPYVTPSQLSHQPYSAARSSATLSALNPHHCNPPLSLGLPIPSTPQPCGKTLNPQFLLIKT